MIDMCHSEVQDGKKHYNYEEIKAAPTLLECQSGLLVLYRFKKKLRKLSVILPCKSDKIALYSFAVP